MKKKGTGMQDPPEGTGKTARRPAKTALWITGGAALAVAALGCCLAAGRLGSVWTDKVPIVEPPASSIGTTAPEPSLVPLDTIPQDVMDGSDDETDAPISAAQTATAGTPPPASPAPETPIYKQIPIEQDTIDILLVGLDARPGEASGRSDTMLLVSYNRKLRTVKLISFLRDTWVPIDGYGWNRLNACYAFGGIGLTINTINKQFRLDIQDYIIIRFEAMESVIDAIGGVTVYLTKEEAAYYNKKNPDSPALSEGMQTLNGDQTLQHTRNRYVGRADFDRTRRQRDVILAIFDKLKSMKDPTKLSKLMGYALGNVKTNLPPDLLFTLALESLGGGGLDTEQGQIPADGTWRYAKCGGRSVLQVNIRANADYLAKMFPEK